MRQRWIEVVGWEKFQHYRDRDPAWIKLYTRLNSEPKWLALTAHQRAVLIGVWIEYARSGCQLAVNTASLSRQLNLRVSSRQLEALSHAGFIRIRASRPLAKRSKTASPEVEVLRTSTKRPLARARRSGSRASGKNENHSAVCPECGMGAGFHVVDCSLAAKA